MLTLSLASDIAARPSVQKLVDQAAKLLERDPSLARPLYDGTLEIRCPLPAGYKTSMNHFATELRGRFMDGGYLFEISERSHGICGSYIGSCIPPSLYAVFLKAWIAYADHPRQRELFA